MASNDSNKLNKACKILKLLMVASIFIVVAIIVLFQTEILLPGARYDGSDACNHEIFVVSTVLEILTVVTIPLVLKLFRFTPIKRALADNPAALLKYGALRMTSLSALLIANIIFYYVYAYSVAFGYMAIVISIASVFIIPTKERCIEEVSMTETNPDAE